MKYRCALIAVLFTPLMVSSISAQEAVETSSPASEEQSKQERASKREKTLSNLQDSMTAEEFKAAGLEKLSDQELETLNQFLKGRKSAERKATEKAVEQATQKATEEATKKATAEAKKEQSRPQLDSLFSRVDGQWTGLTGSTVITLEDGTRWKQADPKERFKGKLVDHPPVNVIHTVFGYKMRIIGTPEFYVDPVRK